MMEKNKEEQFPIDWDRGEEWDDDYDEYIFAEYVYDDIYDDMLECGCCACCGCTCDDWYWEDDEEWEDEE